MRYERTYMRTDLHDIFKLPTQKHNKYLSSKFRKTHRHPSPTELCVTLPKTNSETARKNRPKRNVHLPVQSILRYKLPVRLREGTGVIIFPTQTVHYLEKLPANICIKFDPPSAKNGSHLIIPGVITVLENYMAQSLHIGLH